MLSKRTTNPSADARPPWSPLGVSLSAFLFPAGAAVLTIRNLERLGNISPGAARQLTWAAIGIFAVGFAILILLADKGSNGLPRIDSTSAYVLGFGVFGASYFAQRLPFRAWRATHTRAPTSPWLMALWLAILYQLVTALASTPVLLIGLLLTNSGSQTSMF